MSQERKAADKIVHNAPDRKERKTKKGKEENMEVWRRIVPHTISSFAQT